MAETTPKQLTGLIKFIEHYRQDDGKYPAVKITILLSMYKRKAPTLVQDIVDILGVSYQSATRHLNGLLTDGMLHKDEVFDDGKYKNLYSLKSGAQRHIEDSFGYVFA